MVRLDGRLAQRLERPAYTPNQMHILIAIDP
jgi:hypothetical protein